MIHSLVTASGQDGDIIYNFLTLLHIFAFEGRKGKTITTDSTRGRLFQM